MSSYCPLCEAGKAHDEHQLVDRPIRLGFHWIKVTGGDDGQPVTTIEMYPAVAS